MPGNLMPEEGAPRARVLPGLIARYQADRALLDRFHSAPFSTWRSDRLRAFLDEQRDDLNQLPFEGLSRRDRADYILFGNLLEAEERRLDREIRRFEEMVPLLPFAASLVGLDDARRRLEDIDSAAAARELDGARRAIRETRAGLEAGIDPSASRAPSSPAVACRAAQALDRIREMLRGWFDFYHGYDPTFTWWVEEPYRALEQSLQDYAVYLRERLAGAADPDTIVGDPIGRHALVEELESAMIPYTPEELTEIARREMDWCREELRRAAREMGCGDDWRAALERVKADHVPPGAQPALVRDLAREAIRIVEEADLVTVPPLARECWRMEMISPERQKTNPFFFGGEVIGVSFPTSTMEHEQKRTSLRGNNRAFARATVHHELIPGHHLQAYSLERHHPHWRVFYTPLWVEGWTLHWEMLLWELGFPRTPEERIGMLFWRAHRCARVDFSLGFHLGRMTPDECIELLVNEIGHERDHAAAEVRRSLGGDYDPLYQCAYLIGGLQVHTLHRELTGSGRMSHREFHDAVLGEACMPIEMLRALLTDMPIERSFRAGWRFASPTGV